MPLISPLFSSRDTPGKTGTDGGVLPPRLREDFLHSFLETWETAWQGSGNRKAGTEGSQELPLGLPVIRYVFPQLPLAFRPNGWLGAGVCDQLSRAVPL